MAARRRWTGSAGMVPLLRQASLAEAVLHRLYIFAIAVPNATLIVHFIHTAALGHLGHLDEARTSIETMLRINPKFSMKYVNRVLPTNEQNIRDVILDGLRKAGLPG